MTIELFFGGSIFRQVREVQREHFRMIQRKKKGERQEGKRRSERPILESAKLWGKGGMNQWDTEF